MARESDCSKQNVLRFQLNGAEYTLRGDMSVKRLETIVQLVEQKVVAIKELSPNYTAVRVATLAALQLAADLLDLREENEMMLAEAKSGANVRQSGSAPKKRTENNSA